VGWSALSELVPYYPLYALLFLDTGLSDAQVSALFAVWSITGFVAEVPSGALADRWSRRGVVVLASVLQAAGFAAWTAAPAGWAFAVGFVLWGVSGALVSGAIEALVHDGLADVGAADSFGRVNGWMNAADLAVQVPAAFAASLLFAAGGFPLVGWVSVAVCLAAGAVALRFPEPKRAGAAGDSVVGTLRAGVAEAVHRPTVRVVVLAVALLGGLDAVEEYFPVMAGAWGVPTAAVPVAVLVIPLAGALGAALAGRAEKLPTRALLAVLIVAAACLAAAAVWARPAALAAVALFYGAYIAVLVVAEARLQARITGPHRATVTSVAGLGIELASLLVFAAWAVGGAVAVAVLVLAVVPLVTAGLRAPVGDPSG
jgi:predicted MFS family arabinose efflux permease